MDGTTDMVQESPNLAGDRDAHDFTLVPVVDQDSDILSQIKLNCASPLGNHDGGADESEWTFDFLQYLDSILAE